MPYQDDSRDSSGGKSGKTPQRPASGPRRPQGQNGRPDAARSPVEGEPDGYRPPVVRANNPLVRVLENVINPMESAAKIHESLALAYWPRVAGAAAAAATQADTVRDGLLIVRTKSSVWSHELTLHKARLLQNLNRMLGGRYITDIAFRAQGIDRAEPVKDPEMPTPEELTLVTLEPEEKVELRARLQDLITIPDDRVRQTIATRIVQEAKLRHWRLERGWRVCPQCHTAHNTDYRLCPVCRLGGQ